MRYASSNWYLAPHAFVMLCLILDSNHVPLKSLLPSSSLCQTVVESHQGLGSTIIHLVS